MKRALRLIFLAPILAIGLLGFTAVAPLIYFIGWVTDDPYEPFVREMWGEYWRMIW